MPASQPLAENGANRGTVIWFTGLSGSGKSTIADKLVAELTRRGLPIEYLDGDVIRDMFPSTGFTRPERDAHIKRVGFLASRLEAHGVVVVASLVSPYESSRQFVRNLCRNFTEVYVATPFEECERRDVKGLYAKARRGEIKNFTGLDDPYEPPSRPELVIDTRNTTVDQAVQQVLQLMENKVTGAKHGSS
jgi:adenylylsulfate kinase